MIPLLAVMNDPLSVEEARNQGRLILLAEDNQTNQKVISRQLRVLGYLAEVAEDGEEDLAMWRNGDYKMLLTDCHMPVMDGYRLSETIRHEEPEETRMPIIAITADALKGTAQKCFASGMDDYLTKPLRLHQLQEALEKWLPADTVKNGASSEKISANEKNGSHEAIDPHAMGNLLGTREHGLLAEYYKDFLDTSAPTVEQIQLAFRDSDLSGLSGLAHKLKSSARTVGANGLAECCLALETAGKEGDERTVNRHIALLPDLFNGIKEWIEIHYKS
jgi:CheY-like chemotaxis protein/HPt (histidine-containing phosphotransfer) domain-containing protein